MKKIIMTVTMISMMLSITITAFATTPDIKANNSDSSITLGTGDTLSLTVELDSGDRTGENADWWVLVNTPSGWQYYDLGQGTFSTGISVTYQNGLYDINPTTLFNSSDLTAGVYTYYFAVDLNMNGTLDIGEGQLYYDHVTVNVEGDCDNISGNWYGTETTTFSMLGLTDTVSGFIEMSFAQDGCNVSTQYGGPEMTGTVTGSTINLYTDADYFQSLFDEIFPGFDVTSANTFHTGSVNGDKITFSGSGYLEVSFLGVNISIDILEDTVVLSRLRSSSTKSEMDEKTNSKPFSSLLNNYLEIFTTIAH